ncbi:hypothetical protein NI18_08055 [Sphingomonas sp. Ant20]|nr:hypothetical protein NI18_08055 [Sphingomonas sp. Ant20]
MIIADQIVHPVFGQGPPKYLCSQFLLSRCRGGAPSRLFCCFLLLPQPAKLRYGRALGCSEIERTDGLAIDIDEELVPRNKPLDPVVDDTLALDPRLPVPHAYDQLARRDGSRDGRVVDDKDV